MSAVVLLARIALAVVFVVSAVAKLRDRSGSRDAVQGFGVPAALVGPVAVALPFVELACAALLLAADPLASAGGVASVLLLATFTAAIVVNLARGRRPDCHCFGQLGGGRIGWPTVARNGVLLVVAAVSLVGAGDRGWVGAELADYSGTQLAVGGAAAVLLAVIGALALAVQELMARYGSVLLRLEDLEVRTGLAPPRPAPTFVLPDLDGEVVDLQDVLADDRQVLLVFLSASCHLCDELLPDLTRWQADPAGPPVVVVTSGTVEANRRKFAAVPTLRVLREDAFDLAEAYGSEGTPCAFVLHADGTFASARADGVEPVRALYAAAAGHASHDHELHSIGRRPVGAGDPLPDTTVLLDDGELLPLVDAVGQDAVLLFWRTDCGFCAAIADDVVDLETRTHLLLVTTTPTAALRDSGLASPVLREPDGAVSRELNVPGTPAAVRVRDGVLASPVAVGGPEVLDLLRRASVSGSSADSSDVR